MASKITGEIVWWEQIETSPTKKPVAYKLVEKEHRGGIRVSLNMM